MAVQLDPSGKDDKNDIKTHFVTREGVYRILNLSSEEFAVNPARPRPIGYQSSNQSSPQVRVSIVSLPPAPLTTGTGTTAATASSAAPSAAGQQQSSAAATSSSTTSANSSTTGTVAVSSNGQQQQQQDNGNSQGGDRICFNIGKELYVYSFKGIRKVNSWGNEVRR